MTSLSVSLPQAQVRPEAEAALLLDELTHRTGNELASAICVIAAAARAASAESDRQTLRRVQQQLESFARVQKALSFPLGEARVDASLRLQQLCQAMRLSRLADSGIELVFAGRTLPMPAMRCWRLCLIVSELIANAHRHAFRGKAGSIRIRLSRKGALVECRIADSGDGTGQFAAGRGLGIVTSMVAVLQGRARRRSSPRGTVWSLTIPIEDERPLNVGEEARAAEFSGTVADV